MSSDNGLYKETRTQDHDFSYGKIGFSSGASIKAGIYTEMGSNGSEHELDGSEIDIFP